MIDLRLEDGNGLDVVEVLRARREEARIVVLTGYGAIATAVAAVKIGATDYLSKPADATRGFARAAVDSEEALPEPPDKPNVGGPRAVGTHPARVRAMRAQRVGNGAETRACTGARCNAFWPSARPGDVD